MANDGGSVLTSTGAASSRHVWRGGDSRGGGEGRGRGDASGGGAGDGGGRSGGRSALGDPPQPTGRAECSRRGGQDQVRGCRRSKIQGEGRIAKMWHRAMFGRTLCVCAAALGSVRSALASSEPLRSHPSRAARGACIERGLVCAPARSARRDGPGSLHLGDAVDDTGD